MSLAEVAIDLEIFRREQLALEIDGILVEEIVRIETCHARTRRGVIQEFVAGALELEMSSALRALINARMRAMDFKLTTLHGAKFYKYAVLRSAV